MASMRAEVERHEATAPLGGTGGGEILLRGNSGPRSQRDWNARLVLSAIQRRGPMAGADLARLTGLSAQTASVIGRALEADGLLTRGAARRGRVGKPSMPLSLDPDGAFGIGLRIGRRSADLALLDLAGTVRRQLRTTHSWPSPEGILAFARHGLARLTAELGAERAGRVLGIGIGMPFEIWNWLDAVGAPGAEMARWRDLDLAGAFAAFTDLPVTIGNDVTLACGAEQVFGAGRGLPDFGYLYVGSFVGGGLVLGGRLHAGPSGNAGAFASLPVRGPHAADGQLVAHASLHVLEGQLEAAGIDPTPLWHGAAEDWAGIEPHLTDWLRNAAAHLALACVAVTAVADVPAMVLDGGMPPALRARLAAALRAALAQADTRGITPPEVREGALGRVAGALGAAHRPIADALLIDGSAAG